VRDSGVGGARVPARASTDTGSGSGGGGGGGAARRGAARRGAHLGRLALDAEDEVPELVGADGARGQAEHEADGVHDVALAGAVRADDRVEGRVEGPDDLLARVALEVLDLEPVDAAHGGRERGGPGHY
jgi:hypothetical protein